MEQIDLKKILKEKSPKLYKWMPGFAINLLGKILHVKEMNQVLKDNEGVEGLEFVETVINYLNIKRNVIVINESALSKDEKYVFISNHPLGGLDGLIITSEINRRYGPAKFIVNELLMAVEPLRDLFIPVHNLGTASKENIVNIKNLYNSDFHVLNFPAGACSRLIDGKIQDLEWKKSFVRQAATAGRKIVPIFFGGVNSKHFYWISKIRMALGIKAFIEMILLPDEMFRKRNASLDVVIGEPVSPEEILNSKMTPQQWCDKFREIVYTNGARYSTYR